MEYARLLLSSVGAWIIEGCQKARGHLFSPLGFFKARKAQVVLSQGTNGGLNLGFLNVAVAVSPNPKMHGFPSYSSTIQDTSSGRMG